MKLKYPTPLFLAVLMIQTSGFHTSLLEAKKLESPWLPAVIRQRQHLIGRAILANCRKNDVAALVTLQTAGKPVFSYKYDYVRKYNLCNFAAIHSIRKTNDSKLNKALFYEKQYTYDASFRLIATRESFTGYDLFKSYKRKDGGPVYQGSMRRVYKSGGLFDDTEKWLYSSGQPGEIIIKVYQSGNHLSTRYETYEHSKKVKSLTEKPAKFADMGPRYEETVYEYDRNQLLTGVKRRQKNSKNDNRASFKYLRRHYYDSKYNLRKSIIRRDHYAVYEYAGGDLKRIIVTYAGRRYTMQVEKLKRQKKIR